MIELTDEQVQQVLAVLEYTQNRIAEDPQSEARDMTLADVQSAIAALGGLPD